MRLYVAFILYLQIEYTTKYLKGTANKAPVTLQVTGTLTLTSDPSESHYNSDREMIRLTNMSREALSLGQVEQYILITLHHNYIAVNKISPRLHIVNSN